MRKAVRLRFKRIFEAMTPASGQTLTENNSWCEVLAKIRFRTDPEVRKLRKNMLSCVWKLRAFSRHPELRPFLEAPVPQDAAIMYRQQTAFFLEAARIEGFQEVILEHLAITGAVKDFQSVGHDS